LRSDWKIDSSRNDLAACANGSLYVRREARTTTIDDQRSESLDFHELAVWQLRAALEAAFAAGLAAVKEDQP
jgi:hypothetical protein